MAAPEPTPVDARSPDPKAGSELVRCNLCGADDASELYRVADYRFEVDDVEWPLVQCKRCSLAYVNPRPTADAIWRYYPARFYDHREVDHLRHRYELQADYLNGEPPGKLLDIGCANGDWIQLMAERGWQVSGLEPSSDCTNRHALDIRRGAFPGPKNLWEAGSFDVITSWAVFEHLHDPMIAFQRAAEMLKPRGRLIILVTNIESIASRYGYQEDIPRHLHIFSERTLAQYASKTGLSLERVDHDARFFGGAGRGTLRVRAFEALGWSRADYFSFMKQGHAARMKKSPAKSAVGYATGLVEKVVLSDRLVCALRLNQTIIATLRKP